jgi:hypothetical protein
MAHCNQNILIIDILLHLAQEMNKSVEQIKTLLLIKQNDAAIHRFWEILDILLPKHSYQYFGCCAECGELELRELPPD